MLVKGAPGSNSQYVPTNLIRNVWSGPGAIELKTSASEKQ